MILNWYEERKYNEEAHKRAAEAAARNPELAALVKECSKMVDEKLTGVYELLAKRERKDDCSWLQQES